MEDKTQDNGSCEQVHKLIRVLDFVEFAVFEFVEEVHEVTMRRDAQK